MTDIPELSPADRERAERLLAETKANVLAPGAQSLLHAYQCVLLRDIRDEMKKGGW